jgi:hypothetical protein
LKREYIVTALESCDWVRDDQYRPDEVYTHPHCTALVQVRQRVTCVYEKQRVLTLRMSQVVIDGGFLRAGQVAFKLEVDRPS